MSANNSSGAVLVGLQQEQQLQLQGDNAIDSEWNFDPGNKNNRLLVKNLN